MIELPGSKSYTNRALIIASLCKGKTILDNALISDDTLHLINALRQFGAKISVKKNKIDVISVKEYLAPKKALNLGGSGTGIRLLASFASLFTGKITLSGNKRLKERPIGNLLLALRELGIESESNKGYPPVKIIGGNFNGGICKIKAKESSQYISSLLLISPYAKKETRIIVDGKIVSKPYVDITIDIMKSFGVIVKNKNYKEFIVKLQTYKASIYKIEPDASSASYFLAYSAITKKKITVNLHKSSLQPDSRFYEILENMGCIINKSDFIEIKGAELLPIDIDMGNMPDLVPTLSIVCAFAKGKSVIRNIGHLRLKESDRINSIASQLEKIGIKTAQTNDCLVIYGGNPKGNASIETFNDHRIAMSFAIAGCVLPNVKIKNKKCVNKSFPDFFKVLKEANK
ncbi:MAG: 3-phosphoshikimate 1-carboxyvinyltransferase [archaeon]